MFKDFAKVIIVGIKIVALTVFVVKIKWLKIVINISITATRLGFKVLRPIFSTKF